LPEIPPVLPFSKGGELFGIRWSNSFHFFPLWKRGMKGELTAFQKAKLLLKVKVGKERRVLDKKERL
jgi:hypothetical protein